MSALSWFVLLVPASAASGTVTGRVVYHESVELPRVLEVHVNRRVCGRRPIYDESLVVRNDGGLANAVLSVDAPPPAEPIVLAPRNLEQEDCVFGPHVQDATRGAVLDIGNSDNVIHNVHARLDGRTFFNLAMPIPGIRVKRTLSQSGVVAIQCDSGHDWMSAYVVVFDHPYHTTSATDGSFRIENVPVGRHRLSVWHERLGTRRAMVEVEARRTTELEIDLSRSQVAGELEIQPAPRVTSQSSSAHKLAFDPAVVRSAGGALFARHCAMCHGVRGDGAGSTARYLRTRPRNFRAGSYMFRTTGSGRIPTEDDLVRSIALGLPGSDMPSFRSRLTIEEIRALARYLMTLSPRFGQETPGPSLVIPRPPPPTPERIEVGRFLYGEHKCAQCHGTVGDPVDAEQTDLKDDWKRPVKATDLTRGIYKGGLDAASLYRTLSTGLDGTPMPSYGDVLAPDERWSLVYYVLTLRDRGLDDYLLNR